MIAILCDVAESPFFFHFDEVGVFDVCSLQELRNDCWELVIQLAKSGDLMDNFPFFFLSGRGAAYDELGSPSSPIGSHWLILEPLESQHVKTLINESTFSNLKFEFHKDLIENEYNMVADCLVHWTGGAPRPLLYTTHMLEALHHLHGHHYKSMDGLKRMFRSLVEFIYKEQRLLNELGPVSTAKLTEVSQVVYDYFCFSSYQKTLFEKCFSLPWDSGKKASTYLRSFNIFATVRSGGKIQLIAPAFVTSIVHKKETSFINTFWKVVKIVNKYLNLLFQILL